MATPVDKSRAFTQLRDKAVAQLQAGTAPATTHWSMGVDALCLLHRLSSDPATAGDALKLLHELQVHQVELDLQNEEIAANEQGLIRDLAFYHELFDCAPPSYFLVDRSGMIVQGNRAAAQAFGIEQNDLPGRRVDTFVAPPSRQPLLDLLQRVAQSSTRDSCLAEADGVANVSGQLLFLASSFMGHEHVLLTCCECPTHLKPDGPSAPPQP